VRQFKQFIQDALVEDFHERSIHTFGVPNNTGGGSRCKKNAAMSELYRHDATCWQH